MATHYEVKQGVAVLTMDSPPVNSLSVKTRAGLADGVEKALADNSVKAILVTGAGRAFCAGAEISEFASGPSNVREISLVEVLDKLEKSSKPVVAAIHGFALGGGLEVTLACHWRLADPNTKLGLPEVDLGLLPGAGGTQRLPRILGAAKAAEVMVSGKPLPAKQAKEAGLVDEFLDPSKDRVDQGIQYALKVGKTRPVCQMDIPGGYDAKALDKVLESSKKSRPGEIAPDNIVAAIRAACTSSSFTEGMKEEQRLFMQLLKSPEARALQHAFFAERAANKIPKHLQAEPASVKKVGIVGSGTMGGGIAQCCANVKIDVVLLDMKEEFLQQGLKVIRGNYERSASRGSIPESEVEARMNRIHGTLSYEDFKDCDIVIEAVFESMKVKKDVFTKLDQVCKKGALMFTNTSGLDIDEIAATTSRPQDVMGAHFFSPANVMRLLENVQGSKSSPRTISTAMDFGKRIGKVAVLVGNCPKFVGNRMLESYSEEARALIYEGVPVERVDGVARSFGMRIGPFQMNDIVGLDLFWRARKEAGTSDSRVRIEDALCEKGRYGQKANQGYYKYTTPNGDKKSRPVPQPDPEVTQLIRQVAANNGVIQRGTEISDEEIIQRLFFPLINEGFKILEEQMAYKPSDIDIIYIFGYNFPRHRGGPMFYAKEIGESKVLDALTKLPSKVSTGNRAYWKPAKLLEQCVREKKSPEKVLSAKL